MASIFFITLGWAFRPFLASVPGGSLQQTTTARTQSQFLIKVTSSSADPFYGTTTAQGGKKIFIEPSADMQVRQPVISCSLSLFTLYTPALPYVHHMYTPYVHL